MTMNFEYDPTKSIINKSKHGINFQEAQKLWQDPFLLRLPSKYEAEKRYLFIGKIEQKHWSAITTYRGETIRIISVRRARKEEVKIYES
jgi:uncharacterized DUF497 family protein